MERSRVAVRFLTCTPMDMSAGKGAMSTITSHSSRPAASATSRARARIILSDGSLVRKDPPTWSFSTYTALL